jgi:hypothetical protein
MATDAAGPPRSNGLRHDERPKRLPLFQSSGGYVIKNCLTMLSCLSGYHCVVMVDSIDQVLVMLDYVIKNCLTTDLESQVS